MKLVSLNVEGWKHVASAFAIQKTENPDILCLVEFPESLVEEIKLAGYYTTYINNRYVTRANKTYLEGNLVATKAPHQGKTFLLHEVAKPYELEKYAELKGRHNTDVALSLVNFDDNGKNYCVVLTHFTWGPDGSVASAAQQGDLSELLKITKEFEPHLLCGDFNIPRHHNELYETLTEHYTDNIPLKYKSSLDKNHHRKGDDPSRAHMFTDYMVDYIFSQPPYQVSNVRLEFGLSDHAAVIANISKS